MQYSSKTYYTSWLDILPEDIQTLIWKKVYDCSVEQIAVFGSYKALVKCYLSKHIFHNNNNNIKAIVMDNNDNFIQQNNDNRFYRCGENVKYYKIISQMMSPSSDWDSNNNNNEEFYCAKKFYRDKFNTIKIFNKNIVDTLYKIYMLCNFIPPDWNKIGRWENLAATRYTKFIPES